MKTITFGEVVSFFLPGGAVVLGVSLMYPALRVQIAGEGVTLMTVATFLILAYAAGLVVQPFGEVMGRVYWRVRGGFPTDWIRTGVHSLLAGAQMEALEAQWGSKLGLKSDKSLRELKLEDWHNIIQQIHAAVTAKGRAARLDIYTGNLLLNRGMAAACIMLAGMAVESLVLAGVVGAVLPYSWNVVLIMLAATCILMLRTEHFAKRYARELLIQFIQLPGPSGGGGD